MKKNFRVICICLAFFVFAGCATKPVTAPKFYIDQAVWLETSKDNVYNAVMTALAMEGYSIHPISTQKQLGIIVTNPREFLWDVPEPDANCFYTLQFLVAETQDGRILINVNPMEVGIRRSSTDVQRSTSLSSLNADAGRFMNDRIADHIDKVFAQLDLLLGKANSYKKDRSLLNSL